MKTRPNTPARIRATRLRVNLTQREAADLIHASISSWQSWEQGKRRMPLAKFELFCLRLDELYETV